MKEIAVTTLAELTELLESFGQDTLYRGQTAHFVKGGTPSVVTSFDRKGCIPSVMLKWSRYATHVLQAYVGDAADAPDFMQALLQHYGWRSFYVDCSTSAAVAAWFASHEYSDKPLIDLSEDCDERPVMLIKKRARYAPTDGTGHLYVFDRSVARKTIGVTDLGALGSLARCVIPKSPPNASLRILPLIARYSGNTRLHMGFVTRATCSHLWMRTPFWMRCLVCLGRKKNPAKISACRFSVALSNCPSMTTASRKSRHPPSPSIAGPPSQAGTQSTAQVWVE